MDTPRLSQTSTALKFQGLGVPVFPCLEKTKRPAIAKGFHGASLDPKVLMYWWGESSVEPSNSDHRLSYGLRPSPEYNVGLAMGHTLCCLDIDGEDGRKAFANWCQEMGVKMPDTPTVETPGRKGGLHVYFHTPPGETIKKKRIVPNVDLYGLGVYVLAPGSVHPDGPQYKWRQGCSLDEVDFAPLPRVFYEEPKDAMLATPQGLPVPRGIDLTAIDTSPGASLSEAIRSAADTALDAAVRDGYVGNRNNAAWKLACQLRDNEIDKDEAWRYMQEFHSRIDNNGFPFTEVASSTRSAFKGEARAPYPRVERARERENAPRTTTTTTNTDPWPDPVPFEDPARPPFPQDTFSDAPIVDIFACELAEHNQVAFDLVGIAVLVALSSVASPWIYAHPREGWKEPVQLYGASVALPSERKSPTLAVIDKALQEVAKEYANLGASTRAKIRAERKSLMAKEKAILRKIENGKPPENSDAALQDIQTRLENLEPDDAPRLRFQDATPEALVAGLCRNRGIGWVIAAEGAFLRNVLGFYSAGGKPNLDGVNQGYTGELIDVSRKTGGFEVENPTVTLNIMIQPKVIEDLREKPEARELGFLQRFLWGWPTSRLGYRNTRPVPMQETTRKAFGELLHHIFFSNQSDTPRAIQFSTEADKELQGYQAYLEVFMRPDGGLRDIGDFAGKAAGRAVRIATLLALAENPHAQEVEARHVTKAVAVSNYGLAHARAIIGALPTQSPAAILLDHIKAGKLLDGFTHREVRNKGWAGLKDDDIAAGALQELERRNFIRSFEKRASPQGGRPTTGYDIHPQVSMVSKVVLGEVV